MTSTAGLELSVYRVAWPSCRPLPWTIGALRLANPVAWN